MCQQNACGPVERQRLCPGRYRSQEIPPRRNFQLTKIKIPVVIDHRWGKTALYEDKNEIQFVGKKISTPEQLFVAEKEKLEKAKVHGVDEYLNLARWCLEYGLVGRCKEMIGVAETKMAEAKDQNVSARGRRRWRLMPRSSRF